MGMEWLGLVKAVLETDITPDFIVVDDGEGGTDAAPLDFCDHVGDSRAAVSVHAAA